jgi:hypothetical protein
VVSKKKASVVHIAPMIEDICSGGGIPDRQYGERLASASLHRGCAVSYSGVMERSKLIDLPDLAIAAAAQGTITKTKKPPEGGFASCERLLWFLLWFGYGFLPNRPPPMSA